MYSLTFRVWVMLP